MLGRPLRCRLSECPSCKSRLSMCLSERHLSACLFHVSASGAIIAAATANSRRLSQQNPYKTCVSLVELGQTSRHFLAHFEKKTTKKFPRYGRCASIPDSSPRIELGFPHPQCGVMTTILIRHDRRKVMRSSAHLTFLYVPYIVYLV